MQEPCCQAPCSVSRHLRAAAVGVENKGGDIRFGIPDRRLIKNNAIGADACAAPAPALSQGAEGNAGKPDLLGGGDQKIVSQTVKL